jgi:hypothetical protein
MAGRVTAQIGDGAWVDVWNAERLADLEAALA